VGFVCGSAVSNVDFGDVRFGDQCVGAELDSGSKLLVVLEDETPAVQPVDARRTMHIPTFLAKENG
jgi:hypothetical protein